MPSPLERLPNTYRAFFGSFPSLTIAQKQLIQPILNGEDVVLRAGTGSGKTEAVLAPATENLITHNEDFTIVYIVPTRALALDINRRIKPIYKRLGLKSGIRTGDGKHLLGAKPHLLIMTPESLDVLLGSQDQDNKYFLKHVHMIIIDEVHVFLHNDRGHQLSYLRHRLEMQSIASLQTVAMSATVSSAEEIQKFFKLKKSIFSFKQSVTRKLQPCWVHLEDEERELTLFFDDLHLRWGCQKLLVFANSRKKCEALYDLLNREGVFSQKVLLHYSNLSTKERKFVESSFRNRKMGVCIATSTLELGIDIGDVDGIVLMGPPPSTMAFLQRIGRGNRRQQHINFWGVCQGANAGRQLIRFLALFELAKDNQVEKSILSDNYSVLFQQILSCLYAKKVLSKNSLNLLFTEKSEDIHCIFNHMLANNWLKPTKQPGIHYGGWRYFMTLERKQIWSNFPPTDEEYDVILEQEKIAILPLSTVRQLERGDLIQLTGKVLKVIQIEEYKTSREVWVKESNGIATKELLWCGFGVPTSLEVAQKMSAILLEKFKPEGLLTRTQRLLKEERAQINRSVEQPNGMRVHRLGNGSYRYETFLGSVGNFLLHHLVKTQLAPKIEGLSVNFDELGFECNEWIPFESLKLPHTVELFQEWISSHLPLIKGGFSWNSWIHWLPEKHQLKEISSRLLDLRVIENFQRYHLEIKWLPLPARRDDDKKAETHQIQLKGAPWSLEREKNAWGALSFPKLPSLDESNTDFSLTATQVQGYITHKQCPRWALLQRLNYKIESHPRFYDIDRETCSRKQQGITFKKQVMKELQNVERLYWETAEFCWKKAIRKVIHDQKPMFLAQAKLKVEGSLTGIPDLIYIKHQGSHICLEIWDIKYSHTIGYAQKWKIAFYTHLLGHLLKGETFLFPIKISDLGGLIHPHIDNQKSFEKTPFSLAHYRNLMPRLIAQWKTDSTRSSAIQDYSMDFSCTSCRYFSYCYQESLDKNLTPVENQTIISKNCESNDFPKNSRKWYFVHYDKESIQWQCWENNVSISNTCIRLQDFSNEEAFRKKVASQLEKEWIQSVNQRKNPHFLVYESADWHRFQKTFQSTSLKSLWAIHTCWTSIQTVLKTHFIWPIQERLTVTQVGACLGLACNHPPQLSLYHKESSSDIPFDLCRQIWSWCLSKVESRRIVSFESNKAGSVPLINTYLTVHHREVECRASEILKFQKQPLSERVKQFRSIGPISFLGNVTHHKQRCYQFSIDTELMVSKFRVGDFLKISPVDSDQIQDGLSVILHSYSPEQGTLSIRPLSQKVSFSKNQLYALDESATDWNAPKIEKILHLLKNPNFRPDVIQILLGYAKSFTTSTTHWVEQWYRSNAQAAMLNHYQKEALKLPFREKIGLIEGPPGTGKTHLLVWTLIALVAHAKFLNRPMKILVTAQTHHAIDQILEKLAKTFPLANVTSTSLWKYGRYDDIQFSKLGIRQMQNSEPLYQDTNLILGTTGFGIYKLLENKNFPKLFDWVIFDESSQVLVPSALLGLIFGKGNALFYGDTQQLSPVLMGNYDDTSLSPRSILQELISRYGTQNRLRLNETYRMNSEICKFPSKQWYNAELQSVVDKKNQELMLSNYPLFNDLLDDQLDPSKSMVVVQLDHMGCQQSSQEEADWIVTAVKRLIESYSISANEIGIISPHRLQNNTILSTLKKALPFSLELPRVDTVERMQGKEFDIVIFSATVSDKDTIHSPFLKNYRRFNVALTRSRKKFLFVASSIFFEVFPKTEKELIAQMPFEDFFTLYHQQKETPSFRGVQSQIDDLAQ